MRDFVPAMEKMLANGYDSGLVDAPDFTTGVKRLNLPILSHSGCLPVPPWRALGGSLVLLQEGSSWLWPGFCDQIRLHLEHTGHNKALRDQGQSCPSWRNQVIYQKQRNSPPKTLLLQNSPGRRCGPSLEPTTSSGSGQSPGTC